MFSNCDFYTVEDTRHCDMQCSYLEEDRVHMYKGIYDICPKARPFFERLLGKSVADLEACEMMYGMTIKSMCTGIC